MGGAPKAADSQCSRPQPALWLKHTHVPTLRKCSYIKQLHLMERNSFCSQDSGYLQEVYDVSI